MVVSSVNVMFTSLAFCFIAFNEFLQLICINMAKCRETTGKYQTNNRKQPEVAVLHSLFSLLWYSYSYVANGVSKAGRIGCQVVKLYLKINLKRF